LVTATAVLLLSASSLGLSQSLERTLSRAVTRTNQPVTITETFVAEGGLRGLCLMEEIPVGLTIHALSVTLNGAAINNYTLETGQSADAYPGNIPVRFVLETPPAFSEAHAVPPGGTVRFTYSLNSPIGAAFNLKPAVWTALINSTALPDFGFGSGRSSTFITRTSPAAVVTTALIKR